MQVYFITEIFLFLMIINTKKQLKAMRYSIWSYLYVDDIFKRDMCRNRVCLD